MNLPNILTKHRQEIDAALRNEFTDKTLPLYNMIGYHLGWKDENGKPIKSNSGKYIRASLCLFSCEAISHDYAKALPAAIALELMHNFSLIIDDIQDRDIERRNRPTVWKIWGQPQAINAGMAAFILARMSLTRLQASGIGVEKELQIYKLLDTISIKSLEGQFLDIDFEGKPAISINEYIRMIKLKTGTPIAGSMQMGACLGTEDNKLVELFQEIGMNLGVAYQIPDDVVSIWGESIKTGKLTGSDIYNRKKTFPFVYTMGNCHDEAKKELADIYETGEFDENNLNNITNIYDSVGIPKLAQSIIGEYAATAWQKFEGLKLTPDYNNAMAEFMELLIGGNYWEICL